MALLSFPSAPINGQLYPTSPLPGQNQYEYEAATQTWRLLGAATTVTPGCYGDPFTVPTFCVDAQGRLTSVVNVPIAANSPNLQQVTDEGAVTTNVIDVAGLIAAGLTYPTTDGVAGEVLTTDGAGILGWSVAGTVTDITAGTGLLGGTITTSGTIDLDTAYTDTLYLSLTGGTMTGDIVFSGTQTFPAQDLQEVTDAGATTTNSINVAGLTAAGLIYPSVDGASGDYLTTDGAGNLSWLTPPATPDLDAVTTVGNSTLNAITVGGLVSANLIYPLTDGTVDQVMTTDGAGNLGWLSTLKVVPAPTGSGDTGTLGEVAISTGFFYFHDGTNWLQVPGSFF